MKKLVMLIMFVGLLVMPLSVSAGQCERYWDELVEQSFMTTIDDVDYTLYFGDSVFGPCPCGNVNFSYMDIQDINDISSMVSFDLFMIRVLML